ncbi:hypothetical protein OS493_001283 [Desmophyllum pertusum]|uniref:Proliferation-associated SNF2-like protein n=1 Tax=Desmophyllum pertusum TaxID=174260 RepID=A0A9W9ZU78_9CNID|nr:hypothetical protein OS493_001283 [Desmophyllum pertusum]
MNPVLSVLVNYWKGNSAPCPAADFNGEQDAMKTRFEKSREESGSGSTDDTTACSNNSFASQPLGQTTLDLNNNENTDTGQDKMNIEASHSFSLSKETKANEITTAMEEEERAIHEETSREHQQMMDKAGQEWKNVEDNQRHLRLQLLLEKSSIYCQFLLEKMERQKLEARKRQEKMAQQLEKKKNNEKNTMQTVPQGEGRVTRMAQKKLNGSVESLQSERAASNKRKSGTKRKMEDSSSYMISEYVDRKSLTKRHKASEERNKENENVTTESTSLQCVPEMNEGQLEENKAGCSSSNDDKSTIQPTFVTGGSLRPYQLQGLAWLKVLYENGMNGILADEMGLGKTLQCISLLAHLVEMGVQGPFLVAAPLSTLPNWVAEFHKFAPKIPVILYHGSQEDRLHLRYQMEKLKLVDSGNIFAFPVVITSYEICMRDQKSMHALDWKYIIVDEGHRIKNLNCRLVRELKTYVAANRLLLTGTPLQNNLSELWSLLNFLLPDIFDDLESFQRWFDFSAINEDGGSEKIIEQEREHQVLQRLHAILTPFLLRRLKTDVELSVPPKKEVLVYAPLTLKQQTFYKACLDKTLPDIVGDKKENNGPVECSSTGRAKRKSRQDISYKLFFSANNDEDEVQDYLSKHGNNRNAVACKSPPSTVVSVRMANIMMQLRKCCNHPYLIECPVDQGTLLRKVTEELVTSCGKMLLLDRMLPELKQRGHKVLLFSQMTRMMDILEDYCILRNYGYSRLDGQMKMSDRQEEIKKFEADPSVLVFLLSTRAGGLGLNLAVADTVIIYDSDWNPQMDLQAQDRCHRIGQTKPVVVYRFVTANTVDQKIVERASTKRKLEKMIIHKGKFKGTQDTAVLDVKELRELLEMSDHHKVVSNEGLVMSDKDLKALLDRSDLNNNAEESKQPKTSQNNCGLFRVLDNASDS